MGRSIRERAILQQRAKEKHERRMAVEAELAEAAAAFHRDYLDRERAAAACGVSVHTWKRWQMAGKGPTPLKVGDTKQSRTFWAATDITEYLRDPAGYNRRRAESAAGS
jgi:hypothetical protein